MPSPARLRAYVVALTTPLLLLASCGAAAPVGPAPSLTKDAEASSTPTRSPSTSPADSQPDSQPDSRSRKRPNIVFITTDDQRADEMRWMPHTRRLLGGHGVTFTNALSPHPLCCPARAEWVTGQYGHNNGVHHNKGAYGGFEALTRPADTLAAWLSKAGYRTAMSGKYLNGYKASDGPQTGWTHWNATTGGQYSYFHTRFYDDGKQTKHEGEHVDDVIGDYTQSYIRKFAAQDKPFFVWATDLSPHDTVKGGSAPAQGAKRHKKMFRNAIPPSTSKPTYGRAPTGWVEKDDSSSRMANINARHRGRLRSLQVVDEQVRDIVKTLRQVGELDNTYIVFASDNGYLMGEHNMVTKDVLYDEALRVPVLVRVPTSVKNAPRTGRISDVPVTLVDMAPTFLNIAGTTSGNRLMDGVSFLPLLQGVNQSWRDTQLIQTGRVAKATMATSQAWGTRGVRTSRYTYAIRIATGEELLLDRTADPYEQTNMATDPAYAAVLTDLRSRYAALRDCAGIRCDQSFGPTPDLINTEPPTAPPTTEPPTTEPPTTSRRPPSRRPPDRRPPGRRTDR